MDYEYIAKSVLAQIGYDLNTVEYEVRIHEQSGDIARAVNKIEDVIATVMATDSE